MNTEIGSTYIIRKSFSVLVLRLVVMELLLEGIYVGWRFGIDFLPIIIETKVLLHLFTTIIFIFVTFFQLGLLLIIVIRWLNEYYELQEDELIQWTGVLTKKGKSYPYTNIQSITVEQSWFARLLGYGTVNLYVPALGQELTFDEVPKPYVFIELVKKHMPKGKSPGFLFRKK